MSLTPPSPRPSAGALLAFALGITPPADRAVRLAAVGLALAGLVACAPDLETAATVAPVVYDEDDRVDLFRSPRPELQSLAAGSIAAMIPRGTLDLAESGGVKLRTSSLADQQRTHGSRLCGSVPFQDQPSAAMCSATLIDDDVVMTAGHCIYSLEHCRKMRFVFDYFYSSRNQLESIEAGDDVYACQWILAHERGPLGAAPDIALIQLDRPVVGRTPAKLDRIPPKQGDKVVMIGFPNGLPAKIDDGGVVLDPFAEQGYFRASVDAFGGNSGSGVFRDSGLGLIGVLSGGLPDYNYNAALDCFEVNEIDPSNTTDGVTPGERISPASQTIEFACRKGFKSTRLCGVAPRCGDGLCEGQERFESCSADCREGFCGDSICQATEAKTGTCEADCGGPVPASWTCDPGGYDASDGCDNLCGAPDPDCDQVPGCSSSGSISDLSLVAGLLAGLLLYGRRRWNRG